RVEDDRAAPLEGHLGGDRRDAALDRGDQLRRGADAPGVEDAEHADALPDVDRPEVPRLRIPLLDPGEHEPARAPGARPEAVAALADDRLGVVPLELEGGLDDRGVGA